MKWGSEVVERSLWRQLHIEGCGKITGKFKTWESLYQGKGDDEHLIIKV